MDAVWDASSVALYWRLKELKDGYPFHAWIVRDSEVEKVSWVSQNSEIAH